MKERDWELYNFDNIGGSTEYDNLLINKDIDNYFNNIIAKPVPETNISIIKSKYNLNKFYSDYIEHNLVFIVVLIGIIIFLVIRHYVKDFDTFDTYEKKNDDVEIQSESNGEKNKRRHQRRDEKIENKSKKLEIERNKLINYKMELDREKQQILSIIDELSNINEYENNKNYYSGQHNNQYNQYLNQDINAMYSNNYSNNQVKHSNKINNIQTIAHNDNTSNYYNVNRIQDKQTNEIDGMYIEPPFM